MYMKKKKQLKHYQWNNGIQIYRLMNQAHSFKLVVFKYYCSLLTPFFRLSTAIQNRQEF